MRLNKTQLATKLGCSERALSIWQGEGLPVMEHGARGRSNTYDVADVLDWLRKTGRGMSRVRRGGGGIDLGAIERELQQSPSARAAAEDTFSYIAQHGVIPLAARLCARRGVDPDQALEDVCDVFDVFCSLMRERYGIVDFAPGHDRWLDQVYDDTHAGHQQLVDAIYKAAALEPVMNLR